jgi:hypothetical protein
VVDRKVYDTHETLMIRHITSSHLTPVFGSMAPSSTFPMLTRSNNSDVPMGSANGLQWELTWSSSRDPKATMSVPRPSPSCVTLYHSRPRQHHHPHHASATSTSQSSSDTKRGIEDSSLTTPSTSSRMAQPHVYAIGGTAFVGTDHVRIDTCERFDPLTQAWTTAPIHAVIPSIPLESSSSSTSTTEAAAASMSNKTIAPLPCMPTHTSTCVYDNHMYAHITTDAPGSGNGIESPSAYNAIYWYNDATNVWLPIVNQPNHVRRGALIVSVPHGIVRLGKPILKSLHC